MEQDSNFDAIAAEQQQLDILLDRGMDFTVEKRSILRFFGAKNRTFIVGQLYLGTLDAISDLAIKLKLSEEDLQADPMGESKRLVHQNAKHCARIVAIAVLNSHWKIKLLAPLLASYLLWRLTPKKLFELTITITQMSNLRDFIHAIRYLNATPRTTSPNLIVDRPDSEALSDIEEQS